jgi:hypothetical protein
MKWIVVLGGLLMAMLGIAAVLPAQTFAGGYAKASATKKEVQDAAAYAIKARAKMMQIQKEGPESSLELLKILTSEGQVVAGMNYRLRLQVKVNGKNKQADVVVWWQAWRTPDPYQLTSWKWVDQQDRTVWSSEMQSARATP